TGWLAADEFWPQGCGGDHPREHCSLIDAALALEPRSMRSDFPQNGCCTECWYTRVRAYGHFCAICAKASPIVLRTVAAIKPLARRAQGEPMADIGRSYGVSHIKALKREREHRS